ncbi:hypothetical protein GcM3_c10483o89 [Golovinomyces cichoracearum]|uniref:Uncharacterized protein n=1 Tax=Golovinomyces cichoracearum TaxID=62708 RepID=A0A420JB37_9PEZI|nr:hypothetical protein GcM3_c10483o89 [Golovinomyces cichoracearum]
MMIILSATPLWLCSSIDLISYEPRINFNLLFIWFLKTIPAPQNVTFTLCTPQRTEDLIQE